MTLLTLLRSGGTGGGTGQVGTPTVLHAAESNAVRPWTSPSLSPAGSALVMVVVSNTGSIGDTSSKLASDVTSTFAISGSWQIVQQADPGSTAQTSTHVWYAVTTASPGTGTVTIATGSTPAASHVAIIQLTGVNTTTPLQASATAGAFSTGSTTILHSLNAAPAASTDMALVFNTSRNDSSGATPGSGYTELIDAFHASPCASMHVQYRTGSTSTAAGVDGVNTVHNAILALVVAGAPTGSSFTGSLGLTGSGSLTFAATPTPIQSLALTGSGSLSFTAVAGAAGTLALTGSGSLGLTGIASQGSAYDVEVLADSPVAFFTVTGGAETDKGSGGHTISYTGGTPGTATLPNGETVARFNGTSQYASIADAADLSVPATGILTVEAWVSLDTVGPFPTFQGSGDYVNWLGKGDTDGVGGNNEYLMRVYPLVGSANRPNRISGYAFNPEGGTGVGSYFEGGLTSNTPILEANRWVHVVLTIDTTDPADGWGSTKIWRNGVLKDTDTLQALSIDPQDGNAPLRIGTSDLGAFLDGAIGKVAVYDHVLTSARLKTHYDTMVGYNAELYLTGSGSLTFAGAPKPIQSLALTGSGTLSLGPAVPGPTQTLALTGSGSLTLAGAPKPIASLALTGSGALALTGVARPFGTLALTGSGSLGLTGIPRPFGTLALTGSGTLGLTGMQIIAGTLPLTGSGSLTLAGTPKPTQTLNLTGSGTLGLTAIPKPAQALALSGSGTLVLSGAQASVGTLALSGSGTLTPTGIPTPAQTLALSGSGSLTVAGVARPAQTLNLTGSGSLALTGVPRPAQALSLTGSGTLALGPATPAARGSVALTGSGTLTFAATPRPAQSLALSGSGTLAFSGQRITVSGTLNLTGSGTLLGSAPGQFSGALPLSGSGTLTASGRPATSGTVALTGSGALTLSGRPGAAGTLNRTGSGTLTFTTGAVLVTGTLARTGSGSLTFVPKAGAAGILTLTGAGALTFVPLVGTRGILGLTGSGLLELDGLANVTIIVLPDRLLLSSLGSNVLMLVSETHHSTLHSCGAHQGTLVSMQDTRRLAPTT